MNKIWTWLAGKKTIIAATYWLFYEMLWPELVKIWFNGAAPAVVSKTLLSVGIILSLLGLGHKAVNAVELKIASFKTSRNKKRKK